MFVCYFSIFFGDTSITALLFNLKLKIKIMYACKRVRLRIPKISHSSHFPKYTVISRCCFGGDGKKMCKNI